jgi:hypothetical protein
MYRAVLSQQPEPPGARLARIARQYSTDKAEHLHYLRNYEENFGHLSKTEVRLLELGVYSGGSLLLWRDYFQRGLIVGLDINPVRIEDESGRVRTYRGAQQDTELLDRVARECAPEGFDIIIDDCSHIGVLSRVSFWHLFDNHLKRGGLYVIEDWGTGYWDGWVDGVGYKPSGTSYNRALYRLTRAAARLRRNTFVSRLPLVGRLIARAKAAAVRREYRGHEYGMVGFVKELIDEMGMADITHPRNGTPPQRPSKFSDMRLYSSHLFIKKA